MNKFILFLLLVPSIVYASETNTAQQPEINYLVAGIGVIVAAFLSKIGERLFEYFFDRRNKTVKEKVIDSTESKADILLVALLKIAYWGAIGGLLTAIGGINTTSFDSESLRSLFYGLQHLTWIVVNFVIILIATNAISNVRVRNGNQES